MKMAFAWRLIPRQSERRLNVFLMEHYDDRGAVTAAGATAAVAAAVGQDFCYNRLS